MQHPLFRFVCLVAALLCYACSFAAPPAKQDSLLKRVTGIASRQTQVDVLSKVAADLDCKDSVRKLLYLNQALKTAEETDYKKGKDRILFEVGWCYETCYRKYSDAIKWYTKGLETARRDGNTGRQFSLQNYIANCYSQMADYSAALQCYKNILAMPVGRDTLIQAHGNAGITYQSMGDYTNALAQYQHAYNMVHQDMREDGDPGSADSLNLMGLKFQIASVYTSIPDYERAMANYREISAWNRNIQFDWFDVLVNMGMADCFLKRGLYDSAIENYHVAQLTAAPMRESDDKNEKLSQIYERLAESFLHAGKTDSAYFYIKNSLVLAEGRNGNIKVTTQLPRTYLTMARVLMKKHDYNQSIKYLHRTIDIAKKTEVQDVLSEALLALSRAYEKTGQTKAALETYQQHITLRDSIYSRSRITQLTRIDMQGYYDRRQLDDSLRLAAERVQAGYELQRQRLLTYSGFAGLVLLLLLSFFIFRSYKHEKKTNKVIVEANEAISKEKQVSENLLLNILPEEVAEELKEKGQVEARQFDNVTVLFTDFVDFTKAGERFSPKELVAELHTCFKVFDEIMDKYGIEKIKTIGDAYMAVCGLPVADKDHALNTVRAAIEICEFIEMRKQQRGENAFSIRIGINSGTLVAGIVGDRKFAYDIWGDTVNIAARMEQSGLAGRINISEHTYVLIKDHFNCEYRGELPAKNKGNLKMYFVNC